MRGSVVPVLLGRRFSLAAFMAQQSAGIWYRFGQVSTLFQTTDESSPVTTIGDVIGRANDQRTGVGSPANGTQATNSFRPTYQADGAKFDGLDDRLETSYLASSVNFIVARVTVPATISATQFVAGSFSSGPTSACMLGLNTAGQACGGAGANSFTTIFGSTDLRGTDAVIGLAFDGSTVRLFVNSAVEYQDAQAGTPNTALGLNIGSRNSSGTSSGHFAGSIRELVAGRQMLDLALFNQIANALRSS